MPAGCRASLGLPVNGIATGTTNSATFTEQTFSFQVTGDVVVTAVLFGSLVGLIGGLTPASSSPYPRMVKSSGCATVVPSSSS